MELQIACWFTTINNSIVNPFQHQYSMKKLKEFYSNYGHYFVDVWQYLVIIVIMIVAAIFIL